MDKAKNGKGEADVSALESEWEDGRYLYIREDMYPNESDWESRPRVNTLAISEGEYSSTESEEEGFVIAALEVSPVPKVGTDPLVQDRPCSVEIGSQTDPVRLIPELGEDERTSSGVMETSGRNTAVEEAAAKLEAAKAPEKEHKQLVAADDERPSTSRGTFSKGLTCSSSTDTIFDDPLEERFYPAPVRLDAVKSRQYIRLCVNGKELLGMPDTGSTVNFMSTVMYWRDFSHLPLRQRCKHQFFGVTNPDRRLGSSTTGVVQLCVRFGGKTRYSNFLVGDSHDDRVLILGQKWQDEMRLNIGYDLGGKRVVYMDHRVVPSYVLRKGRLLDSRTRLPIAESSSQLDFTLKPLHSVEVKSGEVMEASEVHVHSGWPNDASQDNDRLWLLPGGIRVPRAYLVTWKDCLVSLGVFAFGGALALEGLIFRRGLSTGYSHLAGPSRSKDSYFDEDFRANVPARVFAFGGALASGL